MFLLKHQPYRECLRIHTIGIVYNRLVYLGFLVFVNIKNLFPNIEELIMLVMVYFVILGLAVVIILSIVRLYYEYRYGE